VVLTSGAQKQGSTEAAPVGRKSVIVALVPISSISQSWGVTLQPVNGRMQRPSQLVFASQGAIFALFSVYRYRPRLYSGQRASHVPIVQYAD